MGYFRICPNSNGRPEVRSRHVSAHEFGLLASSFNALAETVQTEMQSKERVARIAEIMLREGELRRFSQQLLQALLQSTGSQIGALYLLNEPKTDFEHFESIGLSAASRASFSAASREGEFGAALATRQIQRVTNIPEDARLTFSAVTGDFRARELMTIPILSGPEVVGMISLASIRDFPASAVRLVNEVLNVMTARLNGVLAFRQIREFSKKLEHQNREWEAQKKELAVQADELSEQNLVLEMQKKQLGEVSRLKSSFLSTAILKSSNAMASTSWRSSTISWICRGSKPAGKKSASAVLRSRSGFLGPLVARHGWIQSAGGDPKRGNAAAHPRHCP